MGEELAYLSRSAEEERRLSLGSARLTTDGDLVYAVPDFSRAMASVLECQELPAEEPRERDFFPFLVPGTSDWVRFFDTRKVVEREIDGGVRLAAVTSNLVEKLDASEQKGQAGEMVAGKQKKDHKVYDVALLLTDLSLVEKFSVKGSFRAELRNLAVVDTQKAAVKLQRHVRQFQGYERAVVSAGHYSYSWKAARERLKLEAARFVAHSVVTNARFVGEKIFIYGEGQDEDGWRVFGPEKCASLVRLVHRIVSATTCESVIFALGPELTILDIDICVGQEVLCPTRERHAGDHADLPVGVAPVLSAMLSMSDKEALRELCGALDTVSADGMDCATAVRVTSDYVLVNSHVVNEEALLLCGGRPVQQRKMLSRDLWVAQCPGPEVVWHLREPKEGEDVIICYKRHTEAQWLGPAKLLSHDATTLSMDRVPGLLPGMSGAAILAMSDFALLGIYDGVSLRRAIGAAFTAEMFTDICTFGSLDSGSRSAATLGEKESVYTRLKERGLGRVLDEAMRAVVPMYSGQEHVGMGFCQGGKVYTLCDPDLNPLAVSPFTKPLVFSSGPRPYYSADSLSQVHGPAVVRRPSYGEQVLVLGKDDQGGYYSHTAAKVSHVGVDAKVFQLSGVDVREALPLVGGLVVAKSDAAVLGVFSTSVVVPRRGEVAVCYSYPEVVESKPEEEKPEAELLRVFPFLRPGTWPEGLVREAVTHASVSSRINLEMTGLARIGDSAMRTLLMTRLREEQVDYSQWQVICSALQCNSEQSKICWQVGLAKLLRVGGGLRLKPESKVYADMLEAVAGAVYLAEPSDVFETFCEVVGAIKKSHADFG